MDRTTTLMSKQQIEFVKENAKRYGITFSEMIRRIIDEYITKNRKEE